MKIKNFNRQLWLMALAIIASFVTPTYAQWSGVYGNEWIVPAQNYIKIKVEKEGIQKVLFSTLPEIFRNADRNNLQLWFRGQKVAFLSLNGSDFSFYGLTNDGKMDELLYRPGPEARINPYVSLFSDIGNYFLTISSTSSGIAEHISQTSLPNSAVNQEFYLRTKRVVFQDTSTHSLSTSGPKPIFVNSFYEDGRSMTGPRLTKNNIYYKNYYQIATSKFAFELNDRKMISAIAPKVKFLVNGRAEFSRELSISIVSETGNFIRTARVTTPISGFQYKEIEFDLLESDISNNKVFFSIQSSNSDRNETYSISYYSVTYESDFKVEGDNFKLDLQGGAESTSLVKFTGLSLASSMLLNVTNPQIPKIIDGDLTSIKIPRVINEKLKLVVVNTFQTPLTLPVTFKSNDKSDDFLIITSQNLLQAAQDYGTYRSKTKSDKGVNYKTSVVDISDIYNQFNYGEPSPVAIRRYLEYMLSGIDKNKYLLLIGKSITHEEDMVRELPDDVPSIGYPGSDALLVTGLAGYGENDLAIPVGRIPALNQDQVNIYRSKVQEYEMGLINPILDWKRNILHVSGGKDNSQISTFKNKLSSLANNFIPNTNYTVNSYVKSNPALNAENLTMNELQNNAGVGLITFYGHGTTWRVDKNIGYITDVSKTYFNSNKYVSMFFFGCDVSNIYRNRFNDSGPYNSFYQPIPMDWLFAENKGAITVVGNTWDGYSTAFEPFMDILYPKIFVSDENKKPLGKVLQETSYASLHNTGGRIAANYSFPIANIHQMLLLGDPSIKILNTTREQALPVKLASFKAKSILLNSQIEISWSTIEEVGNSHFILQKSYDGVIFEDISTIDGSGNSNETVRYKYIDSDVKIGTNYYRLVQYDLGESFGTYSNIIVTKIDGKDLLVLYPNPTNESINLEIDQKSKLIDWKLYNSSGQLVRKGINEKNINLNGLFRGVYTMEINTSNSKINKKVIIN